MNLQRIVATTCLILATCATVGTTLYVKDRANNTVVVNNDVDPNVALVALKAPDKAKVGELVVLDVSASQANSFRWQIQQKTKNFLVIEDGRRAVFSAEVAGDYTFVIAAAKGDTVDVLVHTIKIAGVAPPGPPTPTDDISTKIATWCEPIQSATKRDDAIKLAQSFSSVAAVITDATTPADIVEATKQSNRDALGANLKSWEPFLVALQAELKAAVAAGTLTDTTSHKEMWKTIADGLKRYAETL